MVEEDKPKSGFWGKVMDSIKPPKYDALKNGASGSGIPENGAPEKEADNLTGDYQRQSPDQKRYASENAAKKLGESETHASEKGNENKLESGLSEVGRKEKEGGFYNESANESARGKNGRAKGKGRLTGLRGKGPVAAIIAVFICVATFVLGGQATMPFSMISQFKESLDSIKTSNEARSETMFMKQLSKTELKDPIHQRYFGFGGTEFKISKNQREKLKTQGIYVDDDFGGTGKTAMLFDDGSGNLKVITANEGDVDTFKAVDPAKVKLGEVDADIDLTKFGVDVGGTMTYKTAYNTIDDFYYGFNVGSRNWRGSVGTWFDNITLKFIQSNKLTRNRFKDFQERVMRQNEGNTRSARRQVMEDAMEIESKNMTSESTDYHMKEETDPDTGEVIDRVPEEVKTSVSVNSKGATKAELRSKIREIVESKMGSNSSDVADMAVNMTCSVFVAVGTVSLLVSAQEFLQVMQVVTSMFEVIDKTEAGYGDDAPIHEMAESLTVQMPTTRVKKSDSDELEEEIIEGKERTSAMNSAGSQSVYSNTPVDFTDESLQEFNLMSHMNNLGSWLGTSVASFSMCAAAKVAVSAWNVFKDVAEVLLALATGGWSEIAIKVGIGAASNIGIGQAVTMITEELLPTAAKWFMKDLTKNLGGEALGNAIFVGAVMYMGNNHMLGGGSLASRTKYAQFAMEQQTLIAEEADFERATRSPFDITSKYTFMGSIMNKLAMIQTAKSPILGPMESIGQMVSSSVMAMLPSASAYDVAKNLIPEEDYEKICPQLTSIGAVGDAACTPYIITDMSTIEMDPLEVVDKVRDLGGIDENGDILDGTNLANKIMDCDNRSMSSYGIIDQNVVQRHSVADAKTGNSTLDNTINGTIGAVPVIGSIVDVMNSGSELANLGWEDGENCVAKGGTMTTGTNEGADSSNATMAAEGSATEDAGMWSEIRIYQRFIEDQRLLESINPDYESPVTAFVEKKEAENPVDDSYEGILARQSGLTIEQVEDTLALLDYYQYIDEYDPSERIAFGAEEKIEKPLRLDNENENQVAGVKGVIANLVDQIAFADVRNRTMTI